jgi:hypothetical protein
LTTLGSTLSAAVGTGLPECVAIVAGQNRFQPKIAARGKAAFR